MANASSATIIVPPLSTKELELPTPKSLLIQVAVWAIVYYAVILNTLVPRLRKMLQAQAFWTEMTQRKGQVLTTMAEESVLTLALSVHHIFGGVIMLAGQLRGDANLWVTGLTVEIAFELVDVACLLVNAWPYPQVQPRLRTVTLLHHAPGLLAAPQLVMAGLHQNEHLQAIGWALLLAGGVSLLTDGLKQTRRMSTQLGQWLALHTTSLSGVLLARFVIFPQASLGLLNDMASGPEWLWYLCAFGIGSMAMFNIIVVCILTEKLVRYGWAWLRGQPAGADLVLDVKSNKQQ